MDDYGQTRVKNIRGDLGFTKLAFTRKRNHGKLKNVIIKAGQKQMYLVPRSDAVLKVIGTTTPYHVSCRHSTPPHTVIASLIGTKAHGNALVSYSCMQYHNINSRNRGTTVASKDSTIAEYSSHKIPQSSAGTVTFPAMIELAVRILSHAAVSSDKAVVGGDNALVMLLKSFNVSPISS